MKKIYLTLIVIMFIGCQSPNDYVCKNEEYDVECGCYGYIEDITEDNSYITCANPDSSWLLLNN